MKHEQVDIEKVRAAFGRIVASPELDVLQDLCESLLAELAALRERGRWRPIAEAPSGRDVLLWSAADGVYIGDVFRGFVNNPSTHENAIPTHWLPLPEAPR